MRVLLDTHCWLWLQTAPERFRADVLELLQSPQNDLLLSTASAWEVAIKYALGRLPLPEPPPRYVPSRMEASGVKALAVSLDHALHVSTLPPHHRDPFDRLIIAQGRIEDIPIVTADQQFASYDVAVHWAD